MAALEQEKAALQQHLDKSTEENTTLTSELLATAEQAVKAEDMAKTAKGLAKEAETRRTLMRNHFRTFKESVRTGAAKLQKELFDLLEKYGLEAPEVSSEDSIGVDAFFK